MIRIEKELSHSCTDERQTRSVESVRFVGNKTEVLWTDGQTTQSVCPKTDFDSRENGVLWCLIKRLFGNTKPFYRILENYVWNCNEDSPHGKNGCSEKNRVTVKELDSEPVFIHEW